MISKPGSPPQLRQTCLSLLLLLFVPSMSQATLFCEAGASSVPTLDPLALSGEVGDLTLACGGGVETDPLPTVSFQAFFNTSLLQDVDPILSDGVNDYPGLFSGANSVLFSSVPFDPAESNFSIQQIFVNPSTLAPDSLLVGFLTVSGGLVVPIDNPQQIVAVNGSLPGPEPAPEPGNGLLLAAGLASLAAFRTRPARRPATRARSQRDEPSGSSRTPIAGIHFRDDGIWGIRVGEAVSLGLLEDEAGCDNQPFLGYSLRKFDGTTVTTED